MEEALPKGPAYFGGYFVGSVTNWVRTVKPLLQVYTGT